MENKFTEEEVKLLNTLSDRPPPSFHVGDLVIRQPSEREIYEKEIEPWEQSVLLEYRSVKEYLYREQHWEANSLDDMRFEEYEMHIYDKKEKAFLKCREGTDGAWKMSKEGQKDLKTEYCRVCKNVQHQMQLWTSAIEIKCFHKEREELGRDKIRASSIKTLMAIAWVGIQMPHKILYTEEETSSRGAARYRLTFEFKKKDIRGYKGDAFFFFFFFKFI